MWYELQGRTTALSEAKSALIIVLQIGHSVDELVAAVVDCESTRFDSNDGTD